MAETWSSLCSRMRQPTPCAGGPGAPAPRRRPGCTPPSSSRGRGTGRYGSVRRPPSPPAAPRRCSMSRRPRGRRRDGSGRLRRAGQRGRRQPQVAHAAGVPPVAAVRRTDRRPAGRAGPDPGVRLRRRRARRQRPPRRPVGTEHPTSPEEHSHAYLPATRGRRDVPDADDGQAARGLPGDAGPARHRDNGLLGGPVGTGRVHRRGAGGPHRGAACGRSARRPRRGPRLGGHHPRVRPTCRAPSRTSGSAPRQRPRSACRRTRTARVRRCRRWPAPRTPTTRSSPRRHRRCRTTSAPSRTRRA